MAKTQKARPASSKKSNSDRKNGKAWKGGVAPQDRVVKPRVKTAARLEKDAAIQLRRAKKRELGMARHAAELAAKES